MQGFACSVAFLAARSPAFGSDWYGGCTAGRKHNGCWGYLPRFASLFVGRGMAVARSDEVASEAVAVSRLRELWIVIASSGGFVRFISYPIHISIEDYAMTAAPFNVLVVDDEPGIRIGLARGLFGEADLVATAADANEALELFGKETFHFVIIDFNLRSGLSGLELLQQFHKLQPGADAIVITAYGSVDVAVQAKRAGALDFVPKPLDLSDVRQRVRSARMKHRLESESNRVPKAPGDGPPNEVDGDVGEQLPSPSLLQASRGPSAAPGSLPNSLAEAVQECERMTINRALQACGRHREKTAKALKISVRTLHYKMGRYSLH